MLTFSQSNPVTCLYCGNGVRAKSIALRSENRLAQCQFAGTGLESKFQRQLLPQRGGMCSCLNRSLPETRKHVAETLITHGNKSSKGRLTRKLPSLCRATTYVLVATLGSHKHQNYHTGTSRLSWLEDSCIRHGASTSHGCA